MKAWHTIEKGTQINTDETDDAHKEKKIFIFF